MTAQSPTPRESSRGFVSSLFDFEFKTLVSPRIIRILYILVIVFAILYALAVFIAGIGSITQGGGPAVLGFLLAFVAAPLLFLVFAAYSRVLLEVALVLFRIEENTRGGGGVRGAGDAVPPTQSPPPATPAS